MKVVFWSGTGNTEAMAEAIAEGMREVDPSCELVDLSSDTADISGDTHVAFGCPAMGSEELEEETFEPFFASVEDSLSDKKVLLFGSYSWAEGEWMQLWTERVKDKTNLFNEGTIQFDAPSEEDLQNLKKLGKEFAEF